MSDDKNSEENVTVETEAQAGVDQTAALIAEKDEEIASLKDRLLRAAAETENVRRRLEKEKQDVQAYAATGFARDLLAVADNLRRALDAVPQGIREHDEVKPILTGIEMTERELNNVFQRHGISRIEAMGQKLDPHRHQAMMEIESADAEPGTIIQELQAGYVMKERLLRPALVGVAKAGSSEPAAS